MNYLNPIFQLKHFRNQVSVNEHYQIQNFEDLIKTNPLRTLNAISIERYAYRYFYKHPWLKDYCLSVLNKQSSVQMIMTAVDVLVRGAENVLVFEQLIQAHLIDLLLSLVSDFIYSGDPHVANDLFLKLVILLTECNLQAKIVDDFIEGHFEQLVQLLRSQQGSFLISNFLFLGKLIACNFGNGYCQEFKGMLLKQYVILIQRNNSQYYNEEGLSSLFFVESYKNFLLMLRSCILNDSLNIDDEYGFFSQVFDIFDLFSKSGVYLQNVSYGFQSLLCDIVIILLEMSIDNCEEDEVVRKFFVQDFILNFVNYRQLQIIFMIMEILRNSSVEKQTAALMLVQASVIPYIMIVKDDYFASSFEYFMLYEITRFLIEHSNYQDLSRQQKDQLWELEQLFIGDDV